MKKKAYYEGLKDAMKLKDKDPEELLEAYYEIKRRIENLISAYGITVVERPMFWYYKGLLKGIGKILSEKLQSL